MIGRESEPVCYYMSLSNFVLFISVCVPVLTLNPRHFSASQVKVHVSHFWKPLSRETPKKKDTRKTRKETKNLMNKIFESVNRDFETRTRLDKLARV